MRKRCHILFEWPLNNKNLFLALLKFKVDVVVFRLLHDFIRIKMFKLQLQLCCIISHVLAYSWNNVSLFMRYAVTYCNDYLDYLFGQYS